MRRTVLLAAHLPDAREALVARLSARLSSLGHALTVVEDGALLLEALRGGELDVVLVHHAPPGLDGVALAGRVRELLPEQELVLLGVGPEERSPALAALASEVLPEPWEPAELERALDRALERAQLKQERARLRSENLELARSQAIQQRALELLSNPDLEWLQERVLQDLCTLCDAQSAALWLLDDPALGPSKGRRQLQLRSYRGLLDKQLLEDKVQLQGTLEERLAGGAPWLLGEGRARILHVPLVAVGEPVGLAQLSDPLHGEFRAEHLRSARELADFAALGIRNGKRTLQLQRLSLRDRETAAYNLSYFTDYANKEIYKARRYGRTFSLLTFSIDNLAQVRLRLGVAEARLAARGIIRALSKIIRDSDVIAKASEHEFYLLLPETDFFGAVMFGRRGAAAVREDPDVQAVEGKLPLALVSGAATYPKDGEDFDELVHQCRRRMEERRASLQRRLHLDGLSFWEEVELLLGGPASPKLPMDERAEPSRRGTVSETLFHDVQAEIARELLRDPLARGVLYVGGPEVRADLPIAQGLDGSPPDLASRVYVLGRRAGLESHPAVTPVFLEGDERLAKNEFVLWLAESSAYAFIQRRGRGAAWGFHSSDTAVVDGLISKLQAEYELQPY